MPTKQDKKFGTVALTNALRKLATEQVSVDNDGNPITKADVLAKLIWDQALGGERKTVDDKGSERTEIVKPVAWAQQYIFERIEGKAKIQEPEEQKGIKAKDRVDDLVRDRLNGIAKIKSGPPSFKP